MIATADNPTALDNEIDSLSEYIPLRDAAATLRSGRGDKRGLRNKRVHVATLYRWTDRGCRGVRLRYVQCGATRATTKAWLDEFFAALTAASSGSSSRPDQSGDSAPLASRTTAALARSEAETDAELRRLGVLSPG